MKFGIHTVTFFLLIVGGLNWLILALFNWDISELFGGMDSTAAKVVYVLVGLSAIYESATHGRCRDCKPDSMGQAKPM
jgi:uncharacterized membrane protein YuzA (DUF378 family)